MSALVLAFLLGYIVGSIPSGVIVTRLAGTVDPRSIGSGNIGATNVLRTGRKDLAAVTLIADALKGTIAVLLAMHFFDASAPVFDASAPLADPGHPFPGSTSLGPELAAACGAFLGHLFPIFLRFRGGKGVATFLGCLIALAWPAALAFAVIWLAAVAATRHSSVGALAASAATPLVLLLLGRRDAALLFVALAIILWIKHAANIRRLAAGTESKVGRTS